MWAPYYDVTDRDATLWVAFYSSLVTIKTHSILELGCGTGKIAIALAGLLGERVGGLPGTRVVGLDESPEMLRIAHARDPRIDWILGDMRSPLVEGAFDLVICCYNTLQLLRTDDDLTQALRAVRRLLRADGIFAFDIYQPNLEWLSRDQTNIVARAVADDQGRRLEVREDDHYDPASRILTTDWRLVEASGAGDQPLARSRFEIRQYFRHDIDRLVASADLTVTERYGDLDRSPFTADSKRQVLVCGPA
jgi:SAM-dependent methyltransferase